MAGADGRGSGLQAKVAEKMCWRKSPKDWFLGRKWMKHGGSGRGEGNLFSDAAKLCDPEPASWLLQAWLPSPLSGKAGGPFLGLPEKMKEEQGAAVL